MNKAIVVTIGDEILYGQITDTNSQYISEQLGHAGIKCIKKISVGDNATDIMEVIKTSLMTANLVITTGGLGPTKDDITKLTIAQYYNQPMVMHEPTLQMVTDFFKKRGREIIEINKKQAEIPANCEVLPNYYGTAPGMWFDEGGKILICLPGVPFEMKKLMESVIPKLITRLSPEAIVHQMIHTVGIGESFLAEKIKDWENSLPLHIKLAYLPSPGIVKLRLTATGKSSELLQHDIQKQTEMLMRHINEYVFGTDVDDKLEKSIGKLLTYKKMTIATAESCTGGYLSHLITGVPGCSIYYKGGVIAYDNALKINNLGVRLATLEKYGAVSEHTVCEMAEGARMKLGSDIGISTSGIAGPDGGTDEKPVGTVWIGYSDEKKTMAKKFTFGTLRDTNIKLAAVAALNMVRVNIMAK